MSVFDSIISWLTAAWNMTFGAWMDFFDAMSHSLLSMQDEITQMWGVFEHSSTLSFLSSAMAGLVNIATGYSVFIMMTVFLIAMIGVWHSLQEVI